MPLPLPEEGELQKDFIARCMSNTIMKKEFPKQEQRLAVCYSQFRKSARRKAINKIRRKNW